MRKILILCLLTTCLVSNAQNIKFTSDEFPGIQKDMTNGNDHYLPLRDNEFLYVGGKLNSEDVTLIKLTGDCKTLWNIPKIEGYLSAAKMGDNILVFSTQNLSRVGYHFINAIHATLIDDKTGKIIAEKDIPSYTNKTVTDIYVLTDSSRNFKCLVLRSTEQDQVTFIGAFKAEQEFGNTDNLQVISLDNGLNVKSNALNITDLQKAQFISCTCNDNGDVFIASIQNNVLTVNKYNNGSAQISQTVTSKTNFENDVATITGSIRAKQNSVSIVSEMNEAKRNASTFISGIADFDNKVAYTRQDLTNKEYLKQYDAKNGDMSCIGAEYYKDKFIVIKEAITFTVRNGQDSYYDFKPLVVSFYSKDMHQEKELTVNEDFRAYISYSSVGYKILGNKLFLFFNYNKGKVGTHTRYQIIDLDNLSLENETELDVDHKLSTILYGPGMIWFNNTALIPFIHQENVLNPNKLSTTFKAADFIVDEGTHGSTQ